MKARPNRAAQVIDPESSTTREDPLWAPSWSLPRVDREPGDRLEAAADEPAAPEALDRIGERLPEAESPDRSSRRGSGGAPGRA